MSADVTPYVSLITEEWGNSPNFMATVALNVQPFADITAVLNTYPGLYDLDIAVGQQLDYVGQWIGQSRYVSTPLVGVYFSFDETGVGYDQGLIWSSGEPLSGLTALPDDIYYLLLKARIAANHWDGTIPGAYAIWNSLFSPEGYQIVIQDNQDMTMTIGMIGANNNPTFLALFTGGYLDLRPAGVLIDGYVFPSGNGPFFGFDVENSAISGWDVGYIEVTMIPGFTYLYTEGGVELTTESGAVLETEG